MKNKEVITEKLFDKCITIILIFVIIFSHMYVLLNYSISFAKEITNIQDIKINIEQELTKHVGMIYQDDTNGVLLQSKIKINIKDFENYKDDILVKNSEIIIPIPKYLECNFNKVSVSTVETGLSNGDIYGEKFSNNNWKIENNEIVISINNDMLNKIQGKDEFYINYYYGEDAYEKYSDKIRNGEYIDYTQSVNVNMIVLNEEKEYSLKNNYESTMNTKDIPTEQVTSEISTENSEINKGKMYANFNNETPIYKTGYSFDTLLNINYTSNIIKINLEDSYESFIKDEEFYVIQNETRYKSTKINKINFINILGEEGYIKIYNSNGELLYTIDKNFKEDNGFYIINYDNDYSSLKFEFSKPINEGLLKLHSEKEFTGKTSLYKQDIQKYNTFQIKSDIKTYINSLDELHQNNNVLNINLTEPISEANMTLSNNKLSTILDNNNLDIKIELNNSNYYSDLWVNPSFIIEFPEEVEDIDVKNTDLLYDGGLEISKIQKIDINNNIAIRVDLLGTQKDFISETIAKGTTIILNVDIKLKSLTVSKKDNIVNLYYQNMNVTQYANTTNIIIDNVEYELGLNTTTIDYVSPMEMQIVQKISNYNGENTVISIGSGEKLGNLEILTDSKISNVDLTILNNTGNECNDIKAIGRIPFRDNKDVITNELLGTTIDTTLEKLITIESDIGDSKITIYYSENSEATTDLNLKQNGWVTEINDIEKIKSFMIYVDNMKNGEMLNFSYSFNVPEQLEHGEYLYPSFGVYFNNITQEGEVEEKASTEKIGLSTGIGAKLKLDLSANFENNGEVNEGEKIKYNIHVENTGSIVANDVIITNPIPKGTTFVKEEITKNDIETINKYIYYENANELKWNIGNIDVGKSIDLEFEVLVDKLPSILEYYGMEEGFTRENGKYYIINDKGEQVYKEEINSIPDIYIENKFYVECSNISKNIESNIWRNKVNLTYITINEESSINKTVYISENQEFEYNIILQNNSDIELDNILVEKEIPEGLIYRDCEVIGKNISIQYDEEKRKLSINLDKLQGEESIEIKVKVKADKLEEDEYVKEIITRTNAILEGSKTSKSNDVINYIGKPNIEYSFNCDVLDRYIYEGDILNYKIVINNKSDVLANKFTTIFKLPENTSFISGKYIEENQEYTILYDESGEIKVETNLKAELILEIKLKVDKLEENLKEKDVSSEVNIYANNFEKKSIGNIKHTILKKNNSSGGDTAPDGTIVYKIKGTAWLDENKDGQRQDSEKLLPNIKVVLLDEKGQIVKDRNTNQEKIVITNEKGEYNFENLLSGKYFVMFVYDTENYDLTYYQKENIGNDKNSDVILTNINFNGQMIDAAITNILNIENRSLYSIDIGLKNKAKFDLEIENTIEKINLNSNGNISTTEYNSNFAKLDIRAKNINNSNVLIEFNIKIKNIGDVEGIANKIVFDKSTELTFNSELNTNWYVGNDGKLYTTQLKDAYIKPGEIKEIKLILSKEMNDKNTGIFENDAKILEFYNDMSLEDKNIENNESKATCLITVATGTVVIYTVLIMIILVILAFGIIFIRKIIKK